MQLTKVDIILELKTCCPGSSVSFWIPAKYGVISIPIYFYNIVTKLFLAPVSDWSSNILVSHVVPAPRISFFCTKLLWKVMTNLTNICGRHYFSDCDSVWPVYLGVSSKIFLALSYCILMREIVLQSERMNHQWSPLMKTCHAICEKGKKSECERGPDVKIKPNVDALGTSLINCGKTLLCAYHFLSWY